MAIIDTHKVFETLTDAGFNEAQAKALVGAVSESHDTLTTKTDLQVLAQESKANLHALAQETKADLQATKVDLQAEIAGVRAEIQALAQETQAEFANVRTEIRALAQETEAKRREMELRMTIRLGAMIVVASGLQIAILGFLLALFTGVLP